MRRSMVIGGLVALVPGMALAASLSLSWKQGTGGTPDGYVIERRSGTEPYTSLGRTEGLTYFDEKVPEDTATCYVIKATRGAYISPGSNEVCMDLPGAPIDLTISTTGPVATERPAKIDVKARRSRP